MRVSSGSAWPASQVPRFCRETTTSSTATSTLPTTRATEAEPPRMQTVLVKLHFGHPYALFAPDYAGDFLDEMSLSRALRCVFLVKVHHESFVIVRVFHGRMCNFLMIRFFAMTRNPLPLLGRMSVAVPTGEQPGHR